MRLVLAILGATFFAAASGCGAGARSPANAVPRPAASDGTVGPVGASGDSAAAPLNGFVRLPDPFAGQAALACTRNDADQALALVNNWRARSGEGPLRCLAPLERVAAAHAAYLAANDAQALTDRHQESPGNPGFTGQTLGLRADAAGLDHGAFWLSEGVGGTGTPPDVVAAHLATVYHRSPLLTPGALYFSYARADGRAVQVVMNTLAWVDVSGLRAAVFPPDGADDVARAFGAAGEVPNPVPDLASPGFPISVHFPRYLELKSGAEPTAVVDQFTLTDAVGALVPARLLAPASDPELSRSDAFLVPIEVLAADRIYEAKIQAHYGAVSLSRTWRFRTQSEAR